MFIGSKEIKVKLDIDDKNVSLDFDDKSSIILNKELLSLIQSEVKGGGGITDNINDFFARKFLAELAYYELGHYFAGNIGHAIGTLAHNLREELFRKTFKCTGADDINLNMYTKIDTTCNS